MGARWGEKGGCDPHLRVQDGGVLDSDVSLHHVGTEQGQRHKGGRTNGETLSNGSSGVSSSVQGISTLTDVLTHGSHLGNASSIVRDGTIGINGQACSQNTQVSNQLKLCVLYAIPPALSRDRDHGIDGQSCCLRHSPLQ